MKHWSWISEKTPDNGWKRRHANAMQSSHPMAQAIRTWCSYAEAHKAQYGSEIGEDYILGPAWAKWGFALRELLNGDCGNLDCGTLDTILHDNLSEQGWNPDTEKRKEG